jgi:hypothetical protein
VSPSATPAPTSTPSPAPTCAATGTAATGIEGRISWNGVGVPSYRVEIRDNSSTYLRLNFPTVDPPIFGSAMTDAAGGFRITGLPVKRVIVWLPEQGPYTFVGYGETRPGSGSFLATCGDRTISVGDLPLIKAMSGASVAYGAQVAAGPLPITWGAVPEATKYCVTMFRLSESNGPIVESLTEDPCPGGYWPGASTVTRPAITTPSLRSGGIYTLDVYAVNGTTVIGVLPRVEFTVR